MFSSTPSSTFEMLPVAGGLFGVALLLFGLVMFALVAAAIVAYLFKRKSAVVAPVPVSQANTINLADGIDSDELQRIQRILAEQTEREKDAAMREKLATALNTEKPTATKK